MNTTGLLISLLNCAVIGIPLSCEDKNQLNDETLTVVYELAKKHDMSHLLS